VSILSRRRQYKYSIGKLSLLAMMLTPHEL
jgi:hypothetical protein